MIGISFNNSPDPSVPTGTEAVTFQMNTTSKAVAGAVATGTFSVGETVTQTTSGATAVVQAVLTPTSGNPVNWLVVQSVTGSPDATHTWTGGSSGATFTPTAVPQTGPVEISGYVSQWVKKNISFSDSPYTAVGWQQLMVDTSGGNVAITLPAVTGGFPVGVTKTTSDANTVTVTPASGNLGGLSNTVLDSQGLSAEMWPDGTNWWF